MTPEYYRELLARRFAGRKVILALGMVSNSGAMIGMLRSLGAERPLLLAEGIGTGVLPAADELTYKVVGTPGLANIMDTIRAYEGALAKPSMEVRALLDTYDPDGSALVVGALFSENTNILGRPYYGARQPTWWALEDKVIIDDLWDELGVDRAPCEIVPVELAALRAAAGRLDRGDGTVWAGDAKQGWHGGAELTRWVRGEDAIRDIGEFFAARCDRLRVMPFLEGIPCSIHGIVFPEYVAALRPVESVTLRRPEEHRFRYCGCATFWDPPDSDREYMRGLAKRVGAALRDRVGFRGTFTIDGVMTSDGFLPTELNPRFGAGINTIAKAYETLPTYLLHLAICQGEPWQFEPEQLERMLIDSSDATRTGGGHTFSTGERTVTENYNLVEQDGAYQIAGPDGAAVATLMVGPSPTGVMVKLTLDPRQNPIGESVAPRFAMALELADRQLGTSFGPSLVAKSTRR